MELILLDRDRLRQSLRHRRLCGGDRFDEVWNGVYVLSPLADVTHQWISGNLTTAFNMALGKRGMVLPGCNVSDRVEKWAKNYRCPDVAVYLAGNTSQDRGTHWLGGPDFAVEVLSTGDRSRKKFEFYASVGVRELLLVSRKPWQIELYQRAGAGWAEPLISSLDTLAVLMSHVLGLSFRLVPDQPRPMIEVACPTDGRTWLA